MHKTGLLISSLCSLIAGMSLTYAYIMGEDNRAVLTPKENNYPLVRQTGLIEIHGEEFVTGLVLGSHCDVVITAGHAAYYWISIDWKGWIKGQRRTKGKSSFYINPQHNTTAIPMTLVKSGYQSPDNIPADEHDWAIFRLQRSAGICQPAAIERAKTDCNGQLLMPAFHFDYRDNKLIDRQCSTRQSVRDELIVHDCDSKNGSSGAPLICLEDDEMSVIGFNVSGFAKQDYHDPGIYGKEGKKYHIKHHKNVAVSIHGEFYKALQHELELSRQRAMK